MSIVATIITFLVGCVEVGIGFLFFIKFKKHTAGLLLLLGFGISALGSFIYTVFHIIGKPELQTYGVPSVTSYILILVGVLLLPRWQAKNIQPLQGATVSRVGTPYPVVWAGLVLAGLLAVAEIILIISLFASRDFASGYGSARFASGFISQNANLILGLTAAVYFYICLFKVHKILNEATDGAYPVSPGMAVGFHFIPFYNLYWFFKWTNDMVRFIKSRNPASRMPIGLMGVLMLLGAFGGWAPVKGVVLGQSHLWLMWFLVLTILTAQVEKLAVYSTDASTESPLNEGA